MSERLWNVYLSGEIHSDWREQIAAGVAEAGLPVQLDAPITVHEDSDDCAAVILGEEENPFWRDQKSSRMNAIRTRTLIGEADIVVVRFGDKYKQWNAAFDAGTAAALGTAMITLHDPSLTHALKEVDAAALAVCETPRQVVQTLAYVIRGALPGRRSNLAAE
jgi:YtoQ family protein